MKVRNGIKLKLMTLVILPVIVVAVAITVFACISVSSLVNSELEQELKIAARTMQEQYETDKAVDYMMENEQFMKGAFNLSDSEHLD